jgi:hypothetical protein
MGNRTLSFQHTTRTTMTNQSANLLKQANVIHAHSIPIMPKHDHSNATNYVWDQSFSISDGHQLKITSPHFLQKLTLFEMTIRIEKQTSLATIGVWLCRPRSLKKPFYQVQATTRLKILKTVPSQQVGSSTIFSVVRSTSRSSQPHLS